MDYVPTRRVPVSWTRSNFNVPIGRVPVGRVPMRRVPVRRGFLVKEDKFTWW